MDEKTIVFLKMMGLKVKLMDAALEAMINNVNALTKILAEKLPALSPEERQVLLNVTSQNETFAETIEASSRQFSEAVDAWIQSQ